MQGDKYSFFPVDVTSTWIELVPTYHGDGDALSVERVGGSDMLVGAFGAPSERTTPASRAALNVFVVEKKEPRMLVDKDREEKERAAFPFEVAINPARVGGIKAFAEGCLSTQGLIPDPVGMVTRQGRVASKNARRSRG